MRLKTTGLIRSRDPLQPAFRLAGVAICALGLLASAGPTWAGILVVGNIPTFSSGSTAGNPAGTWTVGDKTFTYLSQSGISQSGTSPELITIEDSPNDNYHSFSLAGLGGLASSGTYSLGYRVDVIPSSPYLINTVALDSTHIADTATVYKDVFSSLSLFNAAAGTFGNGNLASLLSVNGAPTGAVSLGGPKQVWIRDTIVLDSTGHVSSVVNVITQVVPEIDPTSFASVFSLVVGSLALAERRKGRAAMGVARAATC